MIVTFNPKLNLINKVQSIRSIYEIESEPMLFDCDLETSHYKKIYLI